MWCHLLLVMPALGLTLFLFLPWPLALAGYLPIAVASALMYYKIARALRLPVQTGQQTLLGSEGRVVGPVEAGGLASHLVRCRGELWSVRAPETLQAGDRVWITGFDGGWPIVARQSSDAGTPRAPPPTATEVKEDGR